jgi:hypothetical protein
MARRNKNRYKQRASKTKMMGNVLKTLPTKGSIKNSLIESSKDLVIGVVAGGFAGAAIGRPSLLIGFLASGAGHFLDNRLLTSAGLGMMASNSIVPKGMQGLDSIDGLDGAKERVQAFKEGLMHKTYLDKVKSLKRGKAKTISGLGEVQYFSYPQNMLEGAQDELNFLNQIEHNLANNIAIPQQVNGLDAVEYEEAIY